MQLQIIGLLSICGILLALGSAAAARRKQGQIANSEPSAARAIRLPMCATDAGATHDVDDGLGRQRTRD